MTDFIGEKHSCSQCRLSKKIGLQSTKRNFDIYTGKELPPTVILYCEDCLNGLCFCDICLEKTTYGSYKDHMILHTKEEMMDTLFKSKLTAERNIRDF